MQRNNGIFLLGIGRTGTENQQGKEPKPKEQGTKNPEEQRIRNQKSKAVRVSTNAYMQKNNRDIVMVPALSVWRLGRRGVGGVEPRRGGRSWRGERGGSCLDGRAAVDVEVVPNEVEGARWVVSGAAVGKVLGALAGWCLGW